MLWRISRSGRHIGSRLTFIKSSLPVLADKAPDGPLWTHEIKHDGYRLIARKDGVEVRLCPAMAGTGLGGSMRAAKQAVADRICGLLDQRGWRGIQNSRAQNPLPSDHSCDSELEAPWDTLSVAHQIAKLPSRLAAFLPLEPATRTATGAPAANADPNVSDTTPPRATARAKIAAATGATAWTPSSRVDDENGNPLYGVRLVQDISERKISEQHRELLIQKLNHRVRNTLATVIR